MIEVNGKYNKALIYTNVVDKKAIEQVKLMCDQPYTEGCTIRIMPDVHAGAGCTIGTTMTIRDKICPNLVGVDIGCGMETTLLEEKEINLDQLDNYIHNFLPSGKNIREVPHELAKEICLEDLKCASACDLDRAYKSIGTLGGGNHFIEVDKDSNNNLYLVIHSGSRHLGLEIARYYQEQAYLKLNKRTKTDFKEIINELKAQGKEQEIEATLNSLKVQEVSNIPRDLAYAEGSLLEDYLHDMRVAQKFANLNRQAMSTSIITNLGLHARESFETIHNYIDLDNMILRKGAVSAQKGEKLLIPINMRDGSLICIGKGNAEWNYSAPHGAGRLFSRTQAKSKFNVDDFKKSMSGIYSSTINSGTLDECPMAYKSIDDIVDNIYPTVDIISRIKPIYNFKASD